MLNICAALVIMGMHKVPGCAKPVETPVCIAEDYVMNGVKYRDEWYLFTDADVDLMARVAMSEASTQSTECQEAVVTTILNRYFSPNYPDTIPAVISGQYSTADNGAPTEEIYSSVRSAMKWYDTCCQVIPRQVYYFRGGHYHEWAQDYCKIDDLYFSAPKDACLD